MSSNSTSMRAGAPARLLHLISRWARARLATKATSPEPVPAVESLPGLDAHAALLAQTFAQAGSPIVMTDALDRITLVNEAFERLTGHTGEQLRGQSAELCGLPPLRNSHLPGVDQGLRSGLGWSGEATLAGPGGQALDLWLSVSAIRQADTGRITHHCRLFQDVAPLKAQLRQMAEEARHDSLTGLANRRAFGELMFQAMARARRYTKTLAIMCVDLDGFKAINDAHGHAVGDLLLVAVARRLEACVRTTDRACRMGGDEFMLVLEGPGQQSDIERIAQRVLASVNKPYCLHGVDVHVSPSIGVVIHDGRESAEQLIERADTAMYAAKHAGKSRVVFGAEPTSAPAGPPLVVVRSVAPANQAPAAAAAADAPTQGVSSVTSHPARRA